MPVLSAVADGDRSSSPVGDDHPGGIPPVSSADLDDPARLRGASVGEPLDPDEARTDPATGVVGIGEIPPIRRPRAARRLLPPPPTDRLRGWVVTLLLSTIAAVVRLVDLGSKADGGTPLFDEKYYAIQAWEMLRNGGIEDNQAYGVVVHPPLGKQLIAIGEALFGYTPFGWRFASAVAGVLCVAIIIRAARRLTGSTLLGGIAGVLLICDGVSHVMARTALLDVFQALFVLAAFACVIADRDQVRRRLHESLAGAVEVASSRGAWAGAALGARWWRFGAGVFLGLATGIKWSGAYWVIAFLVMVFVWDVCGRREVGVRRPVRAAVRRDLLPTIWSLGVVPLLVYVGSWWAWFASETAWARHILVATANNRNDWKSSTLYELGALWKNSLWQWTWKMLDFHSHLLTPTDPSKRHPWESKPWTWPLSTRPVLFYSPGTGDGCGQGRTDCVSRIFLVGTPALWWVSLFVLVWALWKAVGRLDWRYAAVLVAYGAGYLPWFTNLDRQMYFFYATPLAPFLVLGIVLVLGDILGPARRPAVTGAPPGSSGTPPTGRTRLLGEVGVERRLLSVAVVAIYVGLVVANFIWLWPILVGAPITPERLTMETWLPSWG
ncbi:phospholipid carrier-dependent glycosyltransferase [Nakamurella flava]|uniref:Polyprenol-phosphate-mannose--protein mannosyltransferase n=1 Tax=Nakamurella flava TaxID=2576308 RepID=A0A4U6QNW3_9ACTN|nr:phospholipid carrier-dependent glycosyltransferase [Nakamurella flava]TKV61766.1 phospholipid carrier-dependent glycosyltransferase [Nakamurella flava]